MNWSPIFDALSSIAQISGITDAGSINWGGLPGASTAFGANRLVMKLTNVKPVGIDYEERTANGLGDQIVTVVGQRTFTWQIRSESMSADPSVMGCTYLSNLEARLNRTSTESVLLAAGLAVVEIRPIVEIRQVSQDRKISSYVLEVVMAAAENDIDDSPLSGEYIASAVISSNQLTDVSGAPTTPQVNVTAGP